MIDTLWSEYVELKFTLGTARDSSTWFTLDDPTLGLLDGVGVLGSKSATFDDRTCDVRSLTWRQGATRTDGVLTRWEAGTLTAVLDNNDGQFDITAPDSVYKPMLGVQLSTRLAGSTDWIPEWTGYADEWKVGWSNEDETVTLTATDGTKILTAYDAPELPSPVGDGDTAAQRVSRILDEAGWRDGRKITAGGHIMQSTTMAQDSWSQLLLNQDAELGVTIIDRDGAVVFKPRNLPPATNPLHIWGPDALRYEDAVLTIDDSLYRNIVDAARTGGTVTTARDQTEVDLRLPHRYGRNDLPFKLDADVAEWCSIVLQTSVDLVPRVDEMEVVPQVEGATLFPVVLGAQYADQWSVTVDPPGKPTAVSVVVQVRGWSHEVDRNQWRTRFYLSRVLTFLPFQLDGGDSGNATLDVMRLA